MVERLSCNLPEMILEAEEILEEVLHHEGNALEVHPETEIAEEIVEMIGEMIDEIVIVVAIDIETAIEIDRERDLETEIETDQEKEIEMIERRIPSPLKMEKTKIKKIK